MAESPGVVSDAAADGQNLYFLAWNGAQTVVARIGLSGGEIQVLARDGEAPRAIALTSDNVFFATEQNLKRVAKTGGKPELFASHVHAPIAADEREIFHCEIKPSGRERLVGLAQSDRAARVLDEDACGDHLATDADAVYFSPSIGGGPLKRVPKAGGAPAVLATLRYGGPLSLAADDVYYCDMALYAVNKHGGAPRRISIDCGDRIVKLGDALYASKESESTGFGGYQIGSVTVLGSFGSRKLFEGSHAKALTAASGAIFFAGDSEKQRTPTWFRLRP